MLIAHLVNSLSNPPRVLCEVFAYPAVKKESSNINRKVRKDGFINHSHNYIGQIMGAKMITIAHRMICKGKPTLKKSVNL